MSSSPATVADVRAIPDFATSPSSDSIIQGALDDAAEMMPAAAGWGNLYSLAHRSLAAHLLAIQGLGSGSSSAAAATSGAVKSRSVGPVSETYETGSSSKGSGGAAGELGSTRFGKLYASLLRQSGLALGMMVVI